jgi:hypothetical protein
VAPSSAPEAGPLVSQLPLYSQILILEQCLQAHTEAIVKYPVARKLHQEARTVYANEPLLAVANSYVDQNTLHLASSSTWQLPSAKMLDGKRKPRKEHYLPVPGENLEKAMLSLLTPKTRA